MSRVWQVAENIFQPRPIFGCKEETLERTIRHGYFFNNIRYFE